MRFLLKYFIDATTYLFRGFEANVCRLQTLACKIWLAGNKSVFLQHKECRNALMQQAMIMQQVVTSICSVKGPSLCTLAGLLLIEEIRSYMVLIHAFNCSKPREGMLE